MLVAQSCPTLCDPRNWAHQAPLSLELSRQGSWNGLPFPSPGDHRLGGSKRLRFYHVLPSPLLMLMLFISPHFPFFPRKTHFPRQNRSGSLSFKTIQRTQSLVLLSVIGNCRGTWKTRNGVTYGLLAVTSHALPATQQRIEPWEESKFSLQ